VGQLRSIKSRKEKIITFFVIKRQKIQRHSSKSAATFFGQMIPLTGSGGQNRLPMSQKHGTEAGRSIQELTAMVYA